MGYFSYLDSVITKDARRTNEIKSRVIMAKGVTAELFHADEQTEMTKLIVAFRNFATHA